ncbi:thiamine phosphate synthase [Chitinophaga defluvii]|uniref:Thiamine phosphate synthase n=1 Tax=Chitinophaga defluvii TaxID=3163343 RepID=A0ABV2T8L5_9BACT
MVSIITSPERIHEEPKILRELLQAGAGSILLRKPGWSVQEYAALLDSIDPDCYPGIRISQYPELCSKYGLGGVHVGETVRATLTSRQMEYFNRQHWHTSTSIHTPAMIPVLGNIWDTLLLGPVFNSISKPGYSSRIKADTRLDKTGSTARIIALGGVDHTNVHLLRQMHFDGAALLGAIWQQPARAIINYHRIQAIWNHYALVP